MPSLLETRAGGGEPHLRLRPLAPPFDRNPRSPLPHVSAAPEPVFDLRSRTFAIGSSRSLLRASDVSSAPRWQAAQSALPRHGGRCPSLTRRLCRHRGAKRRHRVFPGPRSIRRIGLLPALTSTPFAQ